jgi:carbon monoxide dehydrogenase subunit G
LKIESKTGKSSYPATKIFKFISDFRNFNNFIPADKVSDWQADNDHCSFRVSMLGKVRLEIIERVEGKLVKVTSDPEVSQYNFNLWIQLVEPAENDTRIKVTIEPLINQVLKAMVKTPLKEFVNSLIDEIEKFEFPDQ